MGATKTSQELSPLLESSPATSTSSTSTFESVIVPVKSTRSLHSQTKPKEEVYPLPWFRSPDMPKKPTRLVLKKEQTKSSIATWCTSLLDAVDGEKCLHLLVAAILLVTIIVILSLIYDSGKPETSKNAYAAIKLRGLS